jgi:hypothetical protein
MNMKTLLIVTLGVFLTGCAAAPETACVHHHCDPSVDEQFKQNASWDARTPDEYAKVPRTN